MKRRFLSVLVAGVFLGGLTYSCSDTKQSTGDTIPGQDVQSSIDTGAVGNDAAASDGASSEIPVVDTPCTPAITDVSPLEAVLGTKTEFVVTGSCLPETLAVWIAECEGLAWVSKSEKEARFTCTPSWAAGDKEGVVKDKPEGETLFEFELVVSEVTGSPVVTGVSPTTAEFGRLTTFTITGTELPETLAAWIGECEDLTFTSRGAQMAEFTCTPMWSLGEKDGLVKDRPQGSVLRSFVVEVIEPTGTPSVSDVSPKSATLNQSTTFTVTGSNLPSTVVAWIGDCDALTYVYRSSAEIRFTCTPKWTAGTKDGVVKDRPDGTLLYSFQLEVSE